MPPLEINYSDALAAARSAYVQLAGHEANRDKVKPRPSWMHYDALPSQPAHAIGPTILTVAGKALNIMPNDLDRAVALRIAVQHVTNQLLADGYIVTGDADQGHAWGVAHNLTFTFTPVGLSALAHNAIDAQSAVEERVGVVCAEHSDTVPGATVAIVGEALRCIEARCYRAAYVLVGLAVEDLVLDLADAIVAKAKSLAGTDVIKKLGSERTGYKARRDALVAALRELRESIKKQGGAEDGITWEPWEGTPDNLLGFLEAVRFARNTAAHDASKHFYAEDLQILVLQLPLAVHRVAQLLAYVSKPPPGVKL